MSQVPHEVPPAAALPDLPCYLDGRWQALNEARVKAVQDAGYTVPSPIQAQAIPEALAGHEEARDDAGAKVAEEAARAEYFARPFGLNLWIGLPEAEVARLRAELAAAAVLGLAAALGGDDVLDAHVHPVAAQVLERPVALEVAQSGQRPQ